jgi:hypothetical protein
MLARRNGVGHIPAQLSNQDQVLTSILKGETPILRDIRDNRGWGTYGYSVK